MKGICNYGNDPKRDILLSVVEVACLIFNRLLS